MITDAQIRAYRDNLPLAPYDYDAQLTIKIALGKRLPSRDMTQAQARAWVERQIGARP